MIIIFLKAFLTGKSFGKAWFNKVGSIVGGKPLPITVKNYLKTVCWLVMNRNAFSPPSIDRPVLES
jgi:hypothetical protein